MYIIHVDVGRRDLRMTVHESQEDRRLMRICRAATHGGLTYIEIIGKIQSLLNEYPGALLAFDPSVAWVSELVAEHLEGV